MNNIDKRLLQPSGFTIINNNIIQSDYVSNESKLIYIYLLSLPSDWEIHKSQVGGFLGFGRDKVNKAFKELVLLGLIDEVESQGKYNFKSKSYCLKRLPNGDFSSLLNFSNQELVTKNKSLKLSNQNLVPNNQHLQNKQIKKINKENKQKKQTNSSSRQDLIFEKFLSDMDSVSFHEINDLRLNEDIVNCFDDLHKQRILEAYKGLYDASDLLSDFDSTLDFQEWLESYLPTTRRSTKIKNFEALAKKAASSLLLSKPSKSTYKDFLAYKCRFFYKGEFVRINDSNALEYFDNGCLTEKSYSSSSWLEIAQDL